MEDLSPYQVMIDKYDACWLATQGEDEQRTAQAAMHIGCVVLVAIRAVRKGGELPSEIRDLLQEVLAAPRIVDRLRSMLRGT